MRFITGSVGIVSLLTFSACALSTQAGSGSSVSNSSSPIHQGSETGQEVPSVKPGLTLQVSYGDEHEEKVDFVMDERKPIFRNVKPIILPESMPDSMKIGLPSSDWKNLRVGAFGLFGQEVRELKATGSAESKDTNLNINSNEFSLSGFKEAFPQGTGQEGEISLNITSTSGTVQTTRAVEITFRTPPKAPVFEESSLLNLSQITAISPNIAVIPIRFYKMTNTTQYDWTVEMPYVPSGKVVHQIKRASFQQGNCVVSEESGIDHAEYTHQLMLVPEGTAQSQMVKILSEQGEKTSQEKLPSKGSLGYVLYAVTSPTATDPRVMGRNWTGASKLLSPACGPTACARKSAFYKILMPGGCISYPGQKVTPIRDGLYCKFHYESSCDRQGNCDLNGKHPNEIEFGACLEYFIDPISPIAYHDYTEVLGNALVSLDLTSQGRIYFDGLPPKYPDQASPLEKVQNQVSLWGIFDFSKGN